MTQSKDMPAEWARKCAADEVGAEYYAINWERPHTTFAKAMTILARYIEQHEEAPVDPLLVEARELASRTCERVENKHGAILCRKGEWDREPLVSTALAALRRGIELAKEQSHDD